MIKIIQIATASTTWSPTGHFLYGLSEEGKVYSWEDGWVEMVEGKDIIKRTEA